MTNISRIIALSFILMFSSFLFAGETPSNKLHSISISVDSDENGGDSDDNFGLLLNANRISGQINMKFQNGEEQSIGVMINIRGWGAIAFLNLYEYSSNLELFSLNSRPLTVADIFSSSYIGMNAGVFGGVGINGNIAMNGSLVVIADLSTTAVSAGINLSLIKIDLTPKSKIEYEILKNLEWQ